MNNVNSIFGSNKPSLKRRFSESSHKLQSNISAAGDNSIPRPIINRTPSDNLSVPLSLAATAYSPRNRAERHTKFSLPDHTSSDNFAPETHSTSPSSHPIYNKRPLSRSSDPSGFESPTEPDRKRLRLFDQGSKHLHPSKFTGPLHDPTSPPSPLFFSHSPRQRPTLPARFSSAEAGAKMLSKTKGEDSSNVKTVTLARGSYLASSPPTSRPRLRSRLSYETSTSSRTDTSDTHDKSDQFKQLFQIGITEFLDQDDRPTFIIDLADPLNHEVEGLNILYTNLALRSSTILLEFSAGKMEEEETNPLLEQSFPRFKEWLLGHSPNEDNLGAGLPVFVQGSMTWSCSTLRRRFRIVYGALLTAPPAVTSPTIPKEPTSASAPIDRLTRKPSLEAQNSLAVPTYQEPQDYFGVAALAHSAPAEEAESSVPNQDLLASPDHESHRALGSPISMASSSMAAQNEVPASDPHLFTPLEAFNDGTTADNQVSQAKEVGFFDWTRLPLTNDLPAHIRFARSVDWGATALGPIETWSADLRQMCNLIMASPHPAAMYWGDNLVAIYNEAYVFLAGQKHPQLMGMSYREAWAEIWDEVKDVFAGAQTTGQATMKDDDCLFIRRTEMLEETYFSWSIIPMVGGDGSVMGLYNPAFEKTRRKIAERRMLTLREVGERTATARDVKGFWEEVLAALDCNEYDTPFVLLYSITDDDSSDESSVTSGSKYAPKFCYLEGSLGVPEGHVAAPEAVDLKSGTEGFVPIFREVAKTIRPALLDATNGDIPPELLQGLDWRGFGDPSKSVVVCPIHPTTGENMLGFLVMGINPRRPYDDDYSLFVQLLSRQLATSLASVVLFEEEIRRGQQAAKLAALDRIELSEQLAARTQEAIQSETRFTRMAEFAPVGMFIADSQGKMTYCNDTWYEISRVPRGLESLDKWVGYVADEDQEIVARLWRELVENKTPVSGEWRFKASLLNKDGTKGQTWVLFSGYPEKYDDGSLKSVFGSITNISQQKWAEGIQKKKTEEAVELKRQRENFIDTTSHEMRNPLSAILQCADEIVMSLSEARARTTREEDASLFDANIDAAQTISLCAQHQKRIVDDVLTMSKLDSALLVVAPVDVQPITVVQRALKMFEGEMYNAGIEMRFIVDDSFKNLGIDWVKFDPSRALQVLINLITNAIKFTTTERKRTITLTLSAFSFRPSAKSDCNVSYVPAREPEADTTQGLDWGDGETVYIHFSVQDTGRGLSEDEKKSLFHRFKQANPRTHVQYGGSGLGLFISRELTELQGGEIGVASVAGEGSEFAFYVKATRATSMRQQPTENLAQASSTRRTSDGKTAMLKPSVRQWSNGDAISSMSYPPNNQEPEMRRVLIVEDNLVNQRVLQKQLVSRGYHVYVANHGGEALDKLQESRFSKQNQANPNAIDLQVILMDQEMPIMDGITCTKRIREMESVGEFVRHVPIIAVTANARQEQIKNAIEAGMDDVVSKPFRIPDLIPKIEELSLRFKPSSQVQP